MRTMKLTILYNDNREHDRIQVINARRVTVINTVSGERLYYETFNDMQGKGTMVPMCSIECWEVEAVLYDNDHGLKL